MRRSLLFTLISLPAFAILYIFTSIIVLTLLILSVLKIKKPFKKIIKFWAKSVFFIIGRKVHISGIENINRDKKYIIVANHASLFDIVAIMIFYPDVSWFGHERLLKIPVFRNILKMLDYIPVKPSNYKNTKEMLTQLIHKSKGLSIAIFPEGTRTLDGTINDFYRGFIHLMRASEIGLLPVTLNGFYLLKPKNRFHINFSSKINVIIHKPINNDELIIKNDKEIISTVKNVIESAYR